MKALYRKYRPKDFESLVGQDHIIDVLKNQINQNWLSHAYIFSGIRGTGKTSTAKIFARAINCLNYDDVIGPCNNCENCLHDDMYTVELDAASNNSVDDIRQLRESIHYLPNLGNYKVYIIDEVHMLSSGAFNALLKTLEEPPSHVIFILATTELQKIPSTILSRCQKFDFRKIEAPVIADRLEFIAKNEGVEYEREALDEIALYSDGGLRDAISLMDQIMSYGFISIDNFNYVIGFSSQKDIDEMLINIFQRDSVSALLKVKNISDNGLDVKKLPLQLVSRLREVIYKQNSIEESLEVNDEESLNHLADVLKKDEILDLIVSISELESNMKYSMSPQILLETFIISYCHGLENRSNESSGVSKESIDQDRINFLEKKVEYLEGSLNKILSLIKEGNLSFSPSNQTSQAANNIAPKNTVVDNVPVTNPVEHGIKQVSSATNSSGLSVEQIKQSNELIQNFLKQNRCFHIGTLYSYGDVVAVNGNEIVIAYKRGTFYLKRLKEENNLLELKRAFDSIFNGDFKIDARYEDEISFVDSGNQNVVSSPTNGNDAVVSTIKDVFGDDVKINIK